MTGVSAKKSAPLLKHAEFATTVKKRVIRFLPLNASNSFAAFMPPPLIGGALSDMLLSDVCLSPSRTSGLSREREA